jgi:hypothetical protein
VKCLLCRNFELPTLGPSTSEAKPRSAKSRKPQIEVQDGLAQCVILREERDCLPNERQKPSPANKRSDNSQSGTIFGNDRIPCPGGPNAISYQSVKRDFLSVSQTRFPMSDLALVGPKP